MARLVAILVGLLLLAALILAVVLMVWEPAPPQAPQPVPIADERLGR